MDPLLLLRGRAGGGGATTGFGQRNGWTTRPRIKTGNTPHQNCRMLRQPTNRAEPINNRTWPVTNTTSLALRRRRMERTAVGTGRCSWNEIGAMICGRLAANGSRLVEGGPQPKRKNPGVQEQARGYAPPPPPGPLQGQRSKHRSNTTSCGADQGRWSRAPREDARSKQCITEAPTATSAEVHQRHARKRRGGGGGQKGAVIRSPEMPSPAPNHRPDLIVKDRQQTEQPNPTVSSVVDTTPPLPSTSKRTFNGFATAPHLPQPPSPLPPAGLPGARRPAPPLPLHSGCPAALHLHRPGAAVACRPESIIHLPRGSPSHQRLGVGHGPHPGHSRSGADAPPKQNSRKCGHTRRTCSSRKAVARAVACAPVLAARRPSVAARFSRRGGGWGDVGKTCGNSRQFPTFLWSVSESKPRGAPGTRCRGRGGEGCIRREGISEAAPAAVRQAVGGGCQSGWGPLMSVGNAIEVKLALAARETVAGCRRPGGGGGGLGGTPPPPGQCIAQGGGGSGISGPFRTKAQKESAPGEHGIAHTTPFSTSNPSQTHTNRLGTRAPPRNATATPHVFKSRRNDTPEVWYGPGGGCPPRRARIRHPIPRSGDGRVRGAPRTTRAATARGRGGGSTSSTAGRVSVRLGRTPVPHRRPSLSPSRVGGTPRGRSRTPRALPHRQPVFPRGVALAMWTMHAPTRQNRCIPPPAVPPRHTTQGSPAPDPRPHPRGPPGTRAQPL